MNVPGTQTRRSRRKESAFRKAAVGAAAFSLLLTGMATPVAVASVTAPEETGALVWFARDVDGGSVAGASFASAPGMSTMPEPLALSKPGGPTSRALARSTSATWLTVSVGRIVHTHAAAAETIE